MLDIAVAQTDSEPILLQEYLLCAMLQQADLQRLHDQRRRL